MSEDKFSVYSKKVIIFEEEIKRIKKEAAEDSKRLVSIAQSFVTELEQEANRTLEEIKSSINQEVERITQELRQNFEKEKEKNIKQIQENAKKNLNKAVELLLNALEGAYK
ncbi:MAG: hypothetical protein QXV69_02385 [Sulfolobaceae archaeon]